MEALLPPSEKTITDLLIFGTGSVSDMVMDYYLDYSKARVLAFVKSDSGSEREKRGLRVISVSEINEYSYDYILIAAESFDIIYEQCIAAGVPEVKVIGVVPKNSKRLKKEVEQLKDNIKRIFNIYPTLSFFKKPLPEFYVSGHSVSYEGLPYGPDNKCFSEAADPWRLLTLQALSREIKINRVEGNVAELGVYKGDFASVINELFPDKTLYLFDTFQGFSHADIAFDNASGYSNSSTDFSDTSVELVLSKMSHRDKCKIVKGLFPESAANINDVFSFVSIDADLFSPIYGGLRFFYERLSKNGYLLVHDFNNKYFSGVREAVIKFCDEEGIGYCPVSDYNGSVIISKGGVK